MHRLGFRGFWFRVQGSGFRVQTHSGTDDIWVVVKIMVPFWVPNIVRHRLLTVPKKGP